LALALGPRQAPPPLVPRLAAVLELCQAHTLARERQIGPQRRALLFRDASDNELGGVDDGKVLGIVTALEIKRLVLGGVDMRYLPRV
jgi:hypothetical protein